ncbi:MAG: hypothetical protein EOP55_19880 [Sphingobacteriales bacterium]|nr:MAG: hypothetical protein EOP55_19880 [Sphingobacteriales bacterium]
MENYETLVDATNDLFKKGYTANLSLDNDSVNDNSNAYGVYADDATAALLAKLHHNQVSTHLNGADRPTE